MNKIQIFHQCGFRFQWNKEIYESKKIGDGFIISPLDMSNETLDNFDIKESFLDPQFYSLNIYKDNFLSYKFLDEIDNIYDYMIERNNIAKKCVDFQNDKNFKYITIPTIDLNLLALDENYAELYCKANSENVESNIMNINNKLSLIQEIIINPFIKYIDESNIEKKVLLTVIFDDEVAKEKALFDGLLSIITNEDKISGVYLIPQNTRTYKRMTDINYLTRILQFIKILRNNEMDVIVGYCDIESILFTVAGVTGVTLGVYENLRKYDGSKFIDCEYKGRGPSPRIFSNKLMQWVENVYLPVIKEKHNIYDFFEQNEYFDETQSNEYKWHFSKPQCYMHYMIDLYLSINY